MLSKFNPFSANFTNWSNTLTQFVGNLPPNCLSMFDHFIGLALKGLRELIKAAHEDKSRRKSKLTLE